MMKLSEADIMQLEAYWAGQLTASEQSAIAQRLAKDTEFQAAATAWKMMVEDGFLPPKTEAEELEAIKKRLLSYDIEETRTSEIEGTRPLQAVRSRSRVYIALAAVAASLLFWWSPWAARLESDSYDVFFTHLARDNANLSDAAVDGKKAYDERKYKLAYPALLQEVAVGGDSLNLIYAAVAAIGSGEAKKAIPLLEPLTEAENWSLYQADIRWYLALAYLKTGEEQKAKAILQLIISANEAYVIEAKKLMENINSKSKG